MNQSALDTFLAILETGSLANASKRLFVGQSTVTTRLKRLEEELGQSLFTRTKSGVSLTAAGHKFKRYAEAMTDLWKLARQEASQPQGINIVCNLGCDLDLWESIGHKLFSKIDEEFPNTALSIWPGRHQQLDQWLDTGLIDAAITQRPVSHDHQSVHHLSSETLILVSNRPDSPSKFDPGYIYVDFGEEFGRHHTAAYSDAGIARVSFGCSAWALDFLLQRGGSAYLPETLVAKNIQEGQLHVIPNVPTFSRSTYLVCNDSTTKNWPWIDSLPDWL